MSMATRTRWFESCRPLAASRSGPPAAPPAGATQHVHSSTYHRYDTEVAQTPRPLPAGPSACVGYDQSRRAAPGQRGARQQRHARLVGRAHRDKAWGGGELPATVSQPASAPPQSSGYVCTAICKQALRSCIGGRARRSVVRAAQRRCSAPCRVLAADDDVYKRNHTPPGPVARDLRIRPASHAAPAGGAGPPGV